MVFRGSLAKESQLHSLSSVHSSDGSEIEFRPKRLQEHENMSGSAASGAIQAGVPPCNKASRFQRSGDRQIVCEKNSFRRNMRILLGQKDSGRLSRLSKGTYSLSRNECQLGSNISKHHPSRGLSSTGNNGQKSTPKGDSDSRGLIFSGFGDLAGMSREKRHQNPKKVGNLLANPVLIFKQKEKPRTEPDQQRSAIMKFHQRLGKIAAVAPRRGDKLLPNSTSRNHSKTSTDFGKISSVIQRIVSKNKSRDLSKGTTIGVSNKAKSITLSKQGLNGRFGSCRKTPSIQFSVLPKTEKGGLLNVYEPGVRGLGRAPSSALKTPRAFGLGTESIYRREPEKQHKKPGSWIPGHSARISLNFKTVTGPETPQGGTGSQERRVKEPAIGSDVKKTKPDPNQPSSRTQKVPKLFVSPFALCSLHRPMAPAFQSISLYSMQGTMGEGLGPSPHTPRHIESLTRQIGAKIAEGLKKN